MKINRYNYRAQLGSETSILISDIQRMLEEGDYILTGHVRDFEEAFARYIGVHHVRGVNTGTDALLLALLTLGVGPGDEVITQANTFYATVAAICLVGATPVLVDAEETSFLMNITEAEGAINERTRVIIPVHLYGKPTPMTRLMTVAESHGIPVVEDAAQAHGARIHGKRVGSFGTIACFSFHPSKNLAAAGDAGAVTTMDPDIDRQLRRRRELGQEAQNCHVVLGLNSKLDAIQARILLDKLPRLDEWNAGRRKVAGWYRDNLQGLPLRFQETTAGEEHVYHLFQVRTERRNQLMEHLRRSEIDVTIRYPTPIHLQPAFKDQGWRKGEFPIAERLAEELLCLPIRPDMGPEEVEYVGESIRTFFEGGA